MGEQSELDEAAIGLTEKDFIKEKIVEAGLMADFCQVAADVFPDPLARLVALDRERRTLEDRLKKIIEEREPLEQILLEQWADRNQKSANVAGFTVYLRRDFVCSKKKDIETERVINILQAHGLQRYVEVGYDASGLKAWIKEQLKEESDIPELVAACFNYNMIPRLVSRKGNRPSE